MTLEALVCVEEWISHNALCTSIGSFFLCGYLQAYLQSQPLPRVDPSLVEPVCSVEATVSEDVVNSPLPYSPPRAASKSPLDLQPLFVSILIELGSGMSEKENPASETNLHRVLRSWVQMLLFYFFRAILLSVSVRRERESVCVCVEPNAGFLAAHSFLFGQALRHK